MYTHMCIPKCKTLVQMHTNTPSATHMQTKSLVYKAVKVGKVTSSSVTLLTYFILLLSKLSILEWLHRAVRHSNFTMYRAQEHSTR